MKNNKKVYFAALVFLGALVFVWHSKMSSNSRELLKEKNSLVTVQAEYEEKFKVEGYTFDNPDIIVDPYKCSPLTALILFETEDEVTPVVTVKGKDEHSSFSHSFKKGKKHYIPIYGLYPDAENEVLIEVHKGKQVVSKTYKIKTQPLPEDFALPTEVKADCEKLGNELYFFTPSSNGYTCAFDVNGDPRWYLTEKALWENKRLKNGHMMVSTERRINTPYYMTGMYEIDLLGKIYTEYTIPGGYHHNYFEMRNGNILVCSDEFDNSDGTVEDVIVELDRKTGKIVKTFDLKDVLGMEEGKSENWVAYDWFHNNSVWYDEATDSIVLSGRHQDAIVNISHKTGELNWIIGDPTGWSEEYQKYFFQPVNTEKKDFEWQWSQHAAMVTPEGYIFVFDNGNNKSKIKEEYVSAEQSYSRGVMYKIDSEKMTIEQIWEYGKERGNEFYSPYISDVDYLEENHYLVHSGGVVYVDGKNSNQPAGFSDNPELKSSTVELLDDQVIFELTLPTNVYCAEKQTLYTESEFKIGKAQKYGEFDKTRVDDTRKENLKDVKDIDDAYKEHNIKFSKEEDRLVFEGQFQRGHDVRIMLHKDKKAYYYVQHIRKKPYTALCVDVFTDEENENGIVVTKYINKTGLKGEYDIYLELDGTLYDTGQKVCF